MTNKFGNRFAPLPIMSFDTASLSGSYQTVGSPITNSPVLIKFVNNSNVLVTVSWDGVHDHDVLPATSFALYDIGSNKENPENGLYIPAQTQYYVKGSAGTGLFYIVLFYIFESV